MSESSTWGSVIVAYAGVFGLLIGSFLNVVVYRVPAGKSLMPSSRCPKCEAAIRPWQNIPVVSWLILRGRCASCGTRIPARYPLVEAGTGLAFAGVTWWLLPRFEGFGVAAWALILAAYLLLAAVSIALALIDLDTFRLPNVIVLPSAAVFLLLVGFATVFGAPAPSFVRAAIGATVLSLIYAILRWLWRGGMGLGDVKLALLLGAAMAWIGWGAFTVGAFAAFVFGGIYGVALVVAKRANSKSSVPFGPWMILGAWAGLIVGEPVAEWYLTTFLG